MSDRPRPTSLRERAGARCHPSTVTLDLAPEEVRTLIAELDLHQAELELQNEELRCLTLELEAARDRYRDLFDFAPISYVSLDGAGGIREANLAASDLLGCPRADLLGRRLEEFISPDYQDRWYLHHQSVCRTGSRETCEVVLKTGDGHSCHVAIEATLSSEASIDSDRSMRIALVDISERVANEAALRAANARVERVVRERTSELAASRRLNERIVEAVPLPVWIFDFDTRSLVYTNALTGTGLGYEDAESPETIPVHEIIDPADLAELEKLKQRIEMDPTRETVEMTFRIRPAHGEIRWLTSRITVFERDEQGHLSQVLGVSTDVTEQRAAEQRMQRLQQEADLARALERRDLAALLHDSVGQLLPLANTKLALVARSCDAETRLQLTEVSRMIREAHEAATSLTYRLDPPALQEIGLIAGLLALAREMDRDHGLKVVVEDETPQITLSQAVEFAVYRVVHELLVNVAKHSGTKEARVHAACQGTQLLVVVEDAGRGFDPTSSDRKGLGLRSARERLSYLGCRIVIDSEFARGTRVALRIPMIEPGILV